MMVQSHNATACFSSGLMPYSPPMLNVRFLAQCGHGKVGVKEASGAQQCGR